MITDPHPHCIQPLDKSILLWRYMDLPKLIHILEHKQLPLIRLELLNDIHEGSSSKKSNDELYEILRKEFPKNTQEVAKNISAGQSRVRKSAFVSCWHMNNHESEAMWQLYCGGNQGVAIQTTYEKLFNSIGDSETYMGVVSYKDYSIESFPAMSGIAPVMHKRISFEYEREVRIVKMQSQYFNNPNLVPPNILSIPCIIENIALGIYINPYAESWYHDVIKSVVTKFNATLSERVVWSNMKSDPIY